MRAEVELRSGKAMVGRYFGLGCHGERQLRVSSASGINLCQCAIGKLSEVVAKVAMKWFFQVRMQRSARLAR